MAMRQFNGPGDSADLVLPPSNLFSSSSAVEQPPLHHREDFVIGYERIFAEIHQSMRDYNLRRLSLLYRTHELRPKRQTSNTAAELTIITPNDVYARTPGDLTSCEIHRQSLIKKIAIDTWVSVDGSMKVHVALTSRRYSWVVEVPDRTFTPIHRGQRTLRSSITCQLPTYLNELGGFVHGYSAWILLLRPRLNSHRHDQLPVQINAPVATLEIYNDRNETSATMKDFLNRPASFKIIKEHNEKRGNNTDLRNELALAMLRDVEDLAQEHIEVTWGKSHDDNNCRSMIVGNLLRNPLGIYADGTFDAGFPASRTAIRPNMESAFSFVEDPWHEPDGRIQTHSTPTHMFITANDAYRGPLSSKPSSQPGRVYEIPSVIGESHVTNVLGDYCAKLNFMREDYAERLGLPIKRQKVLSITIGSGDQVPTLGIVEAPFRFKDETKVYQLKFHLLTNCIHDVIVGKLFLRATKTFSMIRNFARRVKKRILGDMSQYRLLYLGDSAPRFTGLINGVPHEALADSGAKVLVMDEDYARSLGLEIDEEEQSRLLFADNSFAYTSGMTYNVAWVFGPENRGAQYLLDFHILKNAPAKVILSDEFLFGTEAFSQYDCYLIDEDEDGDDDYGEEAYFFAIDVDSYYLEQAPLELYSSRDGRQLLELIRRGEEEDRIANLPIAEQDTARAIEQKRRARWDAQSSQNAVTNNTTGQMLNGISALPTLSTPMNTENPRLSLRQRIRLRFKLVRKRRP